jgi:hypothetical protein
LAALGVGSVRSATTLLASILAVRMASGLVAHCLIAGREAHVGSLPLLELRDLVGSALFVAAWSGRGVIWRGARYRVAPDGTLHRRVTEPTSASRRLVSP